MVITNRSRVKYHEGQAINFGVSVVTLPSEVLIVITSLPSLSPRAACALPPGNRARAVPVCAVYRQAWSARGGCPWAGRPKLRSAARRPARHPISTYIGGRYF